MYNIQRKFRNSRIWRKSDFWKWKITIKVDNGAAATIITTSALLGKKLENGNGRILLEKIENLLKQKEILEKSKKIIYSAPE